MDKKKILKICLIMIVLIIAILLFCMIRNYTIAKNIINENVDKAINSESIYAKTTIKEGENIRETFDNYKKENKELTVNKMNNEDGTQSIISTYIDGKNSTTYYENKEGKFVQQKQIQELAKPTEEDARASLEKESKIATFFAGAFTPFKSVNIDGKDCYLVQKSSLPIFEDMLNDDAKDRRIYIDKETYMIVKTVADDVITEYEYEFNNVDDNIFIQPDINEYEPYV